MSGKKVLVIGAGPAGLMAAERLSEAGSAVTIVERMATPGRKLLMAGIGGLNLSHSEPLEQLLERYGQAGPRLERHLRAFDQAALQAWAEGLGEPIFTGTSGRIFPRSFKASPLLRAWLARLRERGVQLMPRTTWSGWGDPDGALLRDQGRVVNHAHADAIILALGGASWPRLGSDGSWVDLLQQAGIGCDRLVPTNCGFTTQWSTFFAERHAGVPIKRVRLSAGGEAALGDLMITTAGIEGNAVYALSSRIRDSIARDGFVELVIDLRPDVDVEHLAERLAQRPKAESQSNRLRKAVRLSPPAIHLLREVTSLPREAADLARLVKSVPLRLTAPFPLERAISSAGGLRWDEVSETMMIRKRPGTFAAGEMLNWEAPTGGYLLHGCLATGLAAAEGALAWLADNEKGPR